MTPFSAQVQDVALACRTKLEAEPFAEIVRKLGSAIAPAAAFELLSHVTVAPDSANHLVALASARGFTPEPGIFERVLLTQASLHALTKVADIPVSDGVRDLFLEEFTHYAEPPVKWLPGFRLSHVRFREMARIVTFRRFPAGQFHWEIAALPRSWAIRASEPVQMLASLAQMGGFGPVFELHLNDHRKNRLMLLEGEAKKSYYRAARSIEKQPEIRAMMTASWLFCKSTAEVTPRLSWLRAIPLAGGARIIDVGFADADAGFATGSEERQKLYNEGTYRPRMACMLWPRKQLIQWANALPESAQ